MPSPEPQSPMPRSSSPLSMALASGCEIGVIDALLGFGAEVEDIPTLRSQITYQKFFHFIARVVAGDTDFLFHNVFVFS